MRITFSNPFGPPITLDTSSLSRSAGSFRPSSSTSSLLRRPQYRFLAILFLVVFAVLWRPSPPFPPSYRAEWAVEHGAALGEAEGRSGRYVKFDVPQGTGFNHQLQRVLLQHHLALLGNRSLAFEPFVEDKTVRCASFPSRLVIVEGVTFVTRADMPELAVRPHSLALAISEHSPVGVHLHRRQRLRTLLWISQGGPVSLSPWCPSAIWRRR